MSNESDGPRRIRSEVAKVWRPFVSSHLSSFPSERYLSHRSNGCPADRDRTAQMLSEAARSCPADNNDDRDVAASAAPPAFHGISQITWSPVFPISRNPTLFSISSLFFISLCMPTPLNYRRYWSRPCFLLPLAPSKNFIF